MPFCGRDEGLTAINKIRKHHGAPPLQWSEECASYAQRCASACQQRGQREYGFLRSETTGRRMGQNIYCAMQGVMHSVPGVLQAWYHEVGNYDFQHPGYQLSTGNFTALVWLDTTHFGMAMSQDGRFFVANFFPRGNVVGRANGAKEYETNVLPPNTPLLMRPRNEKESVLFQHFNELARGRQLIPVRELKRLFDRLGEGRLQKVIQNADLDGDGCLDPWELVMSFGYPTDSECERDAELLGSIVGFVHHDVDCNLGLDQKELKRFLDDRMCRTFTSEEVSAILVRFDLDYDGRLDYKELCKFLESGYLGKPPAEGGSFTVTKWDDSVEQLLKSVPLNRRASIEDVKKHVETGLPAKLTRTADEVVIELARPGGGWKRISVERQN